MLGQKGYQLFRKQKKNSRITSPEFEENETEQIVKRKPKSFKQTKENFKTINFGNEKIFLKCDNQNDIYPQNINRIVIEQLSNIFKRKVPTEWSLKRCKFKHYHLFFNEFKVPMCYETYNIIKQFHGDQHRPLKVIKKRIEVQTNLYLPIVEDFIMDYIDFCEVCTQGQKPAKIRSKIWQSIRNPVRTNYRIVLQSLKPFHMFNNHFCFMPQCKFNTYEGELQQILDIFLTKTFPLKKNEQSPKQYLQKIQYYLEIVKKIDIYRCRFGGWHLWTNNKNTRLLKTAEKKYLAEWLHGEQHANAEKMMDKLMDLKGVSHYQMWDTIKKVANSCQNCKKRLKTHPKPLHSPNSPPHSQSLFHFPLPPGTLSSPRKKFKLICSFLLNLPPHLHRSQFTEPIAQYFQLTSKQKQFIERQILQNCLNEKTIDFHHSHSIAIQYLPSKTHFQGIVIWRHNMLNHYLTFGESINISYVHKAIERRSLNGQYFKTLFFTCLSRSRFPLLLCVMLVDDDVETWRLCYEWFFRCFGSSMQTIVIQENLVSETALRSVKKQHNYKFQILINWNSIVQTMQQKIGRGVNKECILGVVCQCLIEKDYFCLQRKLLQLNKIISDSQIFYSFKNWISNYCLSAIEPVFCGYNLSMLSTSKLNSSISKHFKKSKTLSEFVTQVCNFQRELNAEQALNNQKKIIDRNTLISLGTQLGIDFSSLIYQYTDAIISELVNVTEESLISIIKITPLHFCQQKEQIFWPPGIRIKSNNNFKKNKQFYGYLVEEQTRKFTVFYSLVSDHWICSCKMQIILGLPCCHLIPILAHFKGSIEYYVNTRWKYYRNPEESSWESNFQIDFTNLPKFQFGSFYQQKESLQKQSTNSNKKQQKVKICEDQQFQFLE